MDRAAIEELYAYTDFAWERLGKTMEKLTQEQYADPVPGSGWPSVRRAVLHILNAYDGWLNEDKWGLGLHETPFPDVESWDDLYAKVPNWEAIQPCRDSLRATFRKALDVSDEELFTKKTWELEFGPEELSRADVLTNLLLHERGHHGDLSTLFHQLGIRSLFVDYRFFVSKPGDFIEDVEGN
jgi:uncharacterized damage-inducible protein DinB